MSRILISLFVAGILIFSIGEARSRKKTLSNLVQDKFQEALTQVPEDQEVCFSPDENCDLKLSKFIQSAKVSLDIAIFDLTHVQIAHQILVAATKIPVRIIVDRRQAKSEHSLVPLLLKAKANVRIGRQRGIMHNKFMIVDGRMIETGSFNYTEGATSKNNENQVYLMNPKVVDRYKKRFEKIWEEATVPTPAMAEVSRSE